MSNGGTASAPIAAASFSGLGPFSARGALGAAVGTSTGSEIEADLMEAVTGAGRQAGSAAARPWTQPADARLSPAQEYGPSTVQTQGLSFASK